MSLSQYYNKRPSFRPYQKEVYDKISDWFTNTSENGIVVMPTGSGKSYVIQDYILSKLCDESRIVAVIVPSLELIYNIEKDLKTFAPLVYKFFYSPICSNLKFNPNARLFVATYGSFMSKYKKLKRKPTIFVHDECHHAKSKTWQNIVKLPGRHLGFTATPLRLDGKSLFELFPHYMDSGKDTGWFIDQGYLSKFEIKTVTTFKLDDQNTSSGLDNLSQQSKVLGQKKIVGDCVREWRKHAYGLKTIVFTTGKDHSKSVLEAYLEANVSAVIIDSDSSKNDRHDALEGFHGDKYTVIINTGILVEGVDTKDAECVQLLRFTHSFTLYSQMIGRVLRPKPYPAVILDHAGNVPHHLAPDVPIDWEYFYYNQLSPKEFQEQRNPFFLCEVCDNRLIKKTDLKEFRLSLIDSGQEPEIKCKKCGFKQPLPEPKTRKVLFDENQELKEFKMSIGEQSIMKICNGNDPYQKKVAKVANLSNHPKVKIEEVKKGLKHLNVSEENIAIYIDLAKKKAEKSKNKTRKRGRMNMQSRKPITYKK